MAVIISISEKTLPNPILRKLKSLDKVRADKMIDAYNKQQKKPLLVTKAN